MKLLTTISDEDFQADTSSVDVGTYREREAARAVLLNNAGEVFLLNVSNHGYHKLPGGGVDENEEIEVALGRELMEEVGCRAEIVAELGIIIEHRDSGNFKQTSYCYLAKQLGQQVESALEEAELAEGMQEAKASSIEEAIFLLQNDKPDNLEGQFIRQRDLHFLQAAKLYLDK